jgi:hypothetical protein
MAVRSMSILAGRDRMSVVLSRFFEKELARERANDIAQALVFRPTDPVYIAKTMLRNAGIPNVSAVAQELGEAWLHGVIEAERAS